MRCRSRLSPRLIPRHDCAKRGSLGLGWPIYVKGDDLYAHIPLLEAAARWLKETADAYDVCVALDFCMRRMLTHASTQ